MKSEMRKLICILFGLIPEEIYFTERDRCFDLVIENNVLTFRNNNLQGEIQSLKEQMDYLKAEVSMLKHD